MYCDRVDLSEGIDNAKFNNSKECIVCHYWFFNQVSRFCNGCHDLMMLCLNISNIAINSVKRVDYCCIINDISKSEAIHLLENFVLEDRGYL